MNYNDDNDNHKYIGAGDSGGPLFFVQNGIYTQTGLTRYVKIEIIQN